MRLLLVICLLTTALANGSHGRVYGLPSSSEGPLGTPAPARPEDAAVYWWFFAKMDCGFDDVSGSCSGMTVEGCKQKCLATSGCGGFNFPHGFLKKTDCLSNRAPEPSVDLYVVQDHPQPPPPPPASNFPPIWPHPAQFTNGTGWLGVSPQLRFVTGTPSTDLTNAFQRAERLLFPHRVAVKPQAHDSSSSGRAELAQVNVRVQDLEAALQIGVDESYTLDIPIDGSPASIVATTPYGAYHAIQTLSQLIRFDFDSRRYEIRAAPWRIQDKPRFSHREVLMDSSRHFLPLRTLFNALDAMTYAKLNTMHWHLVDSQSFPFDSPSFPELGRKGAYSENERYSAEDIEDVVEYARQRGIRVMVEFDVPGHAASWCAGHPEICPSVDCLEPLRPDVNATWDFLDKLWSDVTGRKRGAGLFPDNMMHLGGDEVNTACWTRSPAISQWLRDKGLTPDQGYAYFVNRAQGIARAQGRDVVGWEEIWNHFGTSLDKSTIIHQWLPGSTISQQATKAGYRCLWSTDGVWYLDGLQVTWETMYVQEPCTGIEDALCAQYMLGGGGEMWGETVDTSNVLQTIWPRAAAIAERLWSPRNIRDPQAARARYAAFRCLLNRRGVTAAPHANAVARSAPKGPGGCYDQ